MRFLIAHSIFISGTDYVRLYRLAVGAEHSLGYLQAVKASVAKTSFFLEYVNCVQCRHVCPLVILLLLTALF